MKLKDKVAIVTGSSQGIGSAIALGLTDAGADLVINYNQNIDAAKKVAEKIRMQGRRTIISQGDVSNSEDVDRIVNEATEAFGKIDILVNNAGIFITGPIEKIREQDWDQVIAVNLKGAFLCCQAVGRHMIKRKSGGSIINVASISGHIPEVHGGAYTPSKAGVIGLTRLLAIEWSKYGIRVNSISPAWIWTREVAKAAQLDDGGREKWGPIWGDYH